MPEARLASWALLGLVALVTGGVYWLMQPWTFLLDDPTVISRNPAMHPQSWGWREFLEAMFSQRTGPLYRPISMLSFAIQEALGFGSPAAYYRLVNTCIHLVNGVLVFLLAGELLAMGQARRCPGTTVRSGAIIVTALWILHPLHVSTVGYIVQRMTLLSGTFTLAGLLLYTHIRKRPLSGPRLVTVLAFGLVPLGILAILCKESGALMLLYALVIELFLFRFNGSDPTTSRWLKAFFGIFLGVPLAGAALWALASGYLQTGYSYRDFTLVERLLTESRVICSYLYWLLWPDISHMGLYHDDYPVSKGLLDPVTTSISLAALIAMVTGIVLFARRQPLFAMGLAFFLAGHVMESTVLPLEPVYEHRNYLPALGVIIGIYALFRQLLSPGRLLVAACLVVPVLAAATALRASDWRDKPGFLRSETRHHPDSPRLNVVAGVFLLDQYRASCKRGRPAAHFLADGRRHLLRATELSSNAWPAAYLLISSYWDDHVLAAHWRLQTRERLLAGRYDEDKDLTLKLLLQCVLRGPCAEKEQWIEDVMLRMMQRAGDDMRGRIAFVAGEYYGFVKGDPLTAIEMLKMATGAFPDEPQYRLSLARQYREAGQTENAQREIAALKQQGVPLVLPAMHGPGVFGGEGVPAKAWPGGEGWLSECQPGDG